MARRDRNRNRNRRNRNRHREQERERERGGERIADANDETSIRRRRFVAVFGWPAIRWVFIYSVIFSIAPWFFVSKASIGGDGGLSGPTRTTAGTVKRVSEAGSEAGRGEIMQVDYSFTDANGVVRTGTSYTDDDPPAVDSTIRITHEHSNPARSVAVDMSRRPFGPLVYAIFVWPLFLVFQLRRQWNAVPHTTLRAPDANTLQRTTRRLYLMLATIVFVNISSAIVFFSLAA